MICFLIRKGYEFTVFSLLADPKAPRINVIPYETALDKTALPRATYVFTDLDRLDVSELTAAARLFQRLKENGCRVLNDPARVRTRLSLLRSLHRNELNPINAYSLEDGEAPERFPVFIRVAEEHSAGPLTDVIQDQEELDRATKALLDAGYPRRALIITEYAAEPVRPGLYRKLSVFRVADQYVPHVCVHDSNWIVKAGKPGIAPMDLYDEELEILRTNPFARSMKKVFENAEIDFGRVDFGLVEGRPCVYEINTNPAIGAPGPHSVPQRVESMKIWWRHLLTALEEIDDKTADLGSQVDVGGDSAAALSGALKTYPALTDGFVRLSKEYKRRGDSTASIQWAETGIVQRPKDTKLIAHLSDLMAEAGRMQEAIALSDQALELDPKDANILFLGVKRQLEAGRRDQALVAVRRALKERPGDSQFAVRLARLLASDESLVADAVDLVELAISLRPKNGANYYLLSQIHGQNGNLAAALEAAISAQALSVGKRRHDADRRVKTLQKQLRWHWLNMIKQPIRKIVAAAGQTRRLGTLSEKMFSRHKD